MESLDCYYANLEELEDQIWGSREEHMELLVTELTERMGKLGWTPKGKLSVTQTMVDTNIWKGKFQKDGMKIEIKCNFGKQYSPDGYNMITGLNCQFTNRFSPNVLKQKFDFFGTTETDLEEILNTVEKCEP